MKRFFHKGLGFRGRLHYRRFIILRAQLKFFFAQKYCYIDHRLLYLCLFLLLYYVTFRSTVLPMSPVILCLDVWIFISNLGIDVSSLRIRFTNNLFLFFQMSSFSTIHFEHVYEICFFFLNPNAFFLCSQATVSFLQCPIKVPPTKFTTKTFHDKAPLGLILFNFIIVPPLFALKEQLSSVAVGRE